MAEIQLYTSTSITTTTGNSYLHYCYYNHDYNHPRLLVPVFNYQIYLSKFKSSIKKIKLFFINLKKHLIDHFYLFKQKFKNIFPQKVIFNNIKANLIIRPKINCGIFNQDIADIKNLLITIKKENYQNNNQPNNDLLEKLYLIENVFLQKIINTIKNNKFIDNDYAQQQIINQLNIIKKSLDDLYSQQINSFNKQVLINTQLLQQRLEVD